MRTMILAATFAVLSSSLAYADDVMASRYGNTTIATDSKGVQTKIYYSADGTLSGKQGALNFKGTWKIANGEVCLHMSVAVPGMTEPFCRPVAARKVGDTWKAGDRTVTLVSGIQ
jgi:hypothetical protein